MERLKRKLKALSKRSWNIDLTYRIKKINEVTRGWINYFRIRFYENEASKHRRTFKNSDKGDNLEAMESGKEKSMGTAKAWRTEMTCL